MRYVGMRDRGRVTGDCLDGANPKLAPDWLIFEILDADWLFSKIDH